MPVVDADTDGALYRFPSSDLHKLDSEGGVSSGHYYRKKLQVMSVGGACKATCYIACDDKVADGLSPKTEYLAHLALGEDLLGVNSS